MGRGSWGKCTLVNVKGVNEFDEKKNQNIDETTLKVYNPICNL